MDTNNINEKEYINNNNNSIPVRASAGPSSGTVGVVNEGRPENLGVVTATVDVHLRSVLGAAGVRVIANCQLHLVPGHR